MAISQKFSEMLQKFLTAALPERISKDIERESRLWVVQCQNCKYEKSVWETGGVRWKASGNPRVYRQCVNCGTRSWHLVYQKAG